MVQHLQKHYNMNNTSAWKNLSLLTVCAIMQLLSILNFLLFDIMEEIRNVGEIVWWMWQQATKESDKIAHDI